MSKEQSLALPDAAAGDDLPAVRRLIAEGVDVNVRDGTGAGALHWAVRVGSDDMCRLLLQAGADVNAIDKHGTTPLHYAASNGCVRICEVLLDAGASPTLLTTVYFTPLDEAVGARSLEVCELFEKRFPGISAAPVVTDRGVKTSFQRAVVAGAHDIVRHFVLEHGADLDQVTDYGRTLIDLAEDDEDMLELLRSLQSELAIRTGMESAAGDTVATPRRPSGSSLGL